MSTTQERMNKAIEAMQRESDKQVLETMLKQYTTMYNQQKDHPSIFTGVCWWISVDGVMYWDLLCNDGHGDFSIGNSYEEAVHWFMHKMFELGYEARAAEGK